METGARAFEVKDYVRIFTKRKWFVLLVTLAATIIGGLYSIGYHPTYRAQAIVLIRRQPVERIRFTEEEAIGPEEKREELTLETQARIATSYDAAVRTAKKLSARESGTKVVTDPREIKESLEALPQEPDRLLVQATNSERDKALAFANESAETFVTMSAELRRSDVAAARAFLEQQLEGVSGRLDRLEEELAGYQHRVGVVVPEVEASAEISELQAYRRELNNARIDLDTLNVRRSTLQRQLARSKPLVEVDMKEANPEREIIEAQLRQERVNLATLLARYKENHPSVVSAKRRIEALEARLALVPESRDVKRFDINPAVEVIKNEINATELAVAEARQRISRLEAIVTQLQNDTADLPLQLATISRLQGQIELARSTYQSFLIQLEQSKLREAIKQSGASVIDRAVDAEEIKPRFGRMLIFAFALGLFCGLMFALLLEALDDTFHSPEDITYYTDVPFLGMVPMLEAEGDDLVTISAPKSPPAEAYRALRSNIHFAQVDNPAHTFLVTSAGAGEGKSLTVANLAVVFAQAGQRVLLIDSDLRRPSLQRLFKVDREHGLTNVLIGESALEDVMIEVEQVPGLFIVPTGPLPPKPADLVDSERMTDIIREAARFADIVFFDSPPAIVLTDAVLLSSKVDRTILIAECEHVSRTAFLEMIRLIRHARGEILGTVLNKLRLTTADYYYYYYYYYDYGRETPLPGAVESEEEPGTAGDITADLFGEPETPAEPVGFEEPEASEEPKAPERPEEPDTYAPDVLSDDLFGEPTEPATREPEEPEEPEAAPPPDCLLYTSPSPRDRTRSRMPSSA